MKYTYSLMLMSLLSGCLWAQCTCTSQYMTEDQKIRTYPHPWPCIERDSIVVGEKRVRFTHNWLDNESRDQWREIDTMPDDDGYVYLPRVDGKGVERIKRKVVMSRIVCSADRCSEHGYPLRPPGPKLPIPMELQ